MAPLQLKLGKKRREEADLKRALVRAALQTHKKKVPEIMAREEDVCQSF